MSNQYHEQQSLPMPALQRGMSASLLWRRQQSAPSLGAAPHLLVTSPSDNTMSILPRAPLASSTVSVAATGTESFQRQTLKAVSSAHAFPQSSLLLPAREEKMTPDSAYSDVAGCGGRIPACFMLPTEKMIYTPRHKAVPLSYLQPDLSNGSNSDDRGFTPLMSGNAPLETQLPREVLPAVHPNATIVAPQQQYGRPADVKRRSYSISMLDSSDTALEAETMRCLLQYKDTLLTQNSNAEPPRHRGAAAAALASLASRDSAFLIPPHPPARVARPARRGKSNRPRVVKFSGTVDIGDGKIAPMQETNVYRESMMPTPLPRSPDFFIKKGRSIYRGLRKPSLPRIAPGS